MTPQELKASILQLAVQGKLVEQRSEEGTGEELYQHIQTEKQALIKAGKIKKEKPLTEIAKDDIPFEIPETWKWVRIGSLLHKLVDGTHRTPKYTTSGIPFVSVRNMSNGILSLEDTKFISAEEHRELWNRCNPQRGDILLSKVGTTGVPAKVNTDEEFSLFVSVALLKFNNELLDIDFLIYSILAPDFQMQCKEHTRGVGNKNWVIVDIANTIMPLPPLAEQKRIVAKIEELLPYIDRYEQAWSKLENFNKRFPVDMQKSILQMSIQGKLVEQRPEEGTGEELYQQIQVEKQALIKAGKIKKEKPLPEIAVDELPFDIPESWMWVSVGSVCTNIQYGSSQKSALSGKMAVLRMGNIQNGRIVLDKLVYTSDDEEIAKYPLQYDDLLFNRTNSKELVGKTAIYKEEIPAIYAGYLVRITPLLMSSDYLNYVMQSQFYWSYCQTVRSDAIGQSNINAEKLKRFVFPLPPLAEQKRIVAKLEEILPLCERLK